MKLKKNVLGSLVFSIATIFMSVYLYTLFVAFFGDIVEQMNYAVYVFNVSLEYLLAGASVLLLAILCLAFYSIFGKLKKKADSILLFRLIYIAFILGALVHFSYYIVSYVKDVFVGNISTFDSIVPFINNLALFSEPTSEYAVPYLYSVFVSFFLKVLGVNVFVPVFFNVILSFFSIILISFTIDYLWGFIPSSLSFAVMIVFSTKFNCFDNVTGLSLWIFFVSLYSFVFAFFFENVIRKKKGLGLFLLIVFSIIPFALRPYLLTRYRFSFDFSNFSVSNLGIYSCLCILALLSLAFCGQLSYMSSKYNNVLFVDLLFIAVYVMAYLDRSNNAYSVLLVILMSILFGLFIDTLVEVSGATEDGKDSIDIAIERIELAEEQENSEKTDSNEASELSESDVSSEESNETTDEKTFDSSDLNVAEEVKEVVVIEEIVPAENNDDADISISQSVITVDSIISDSSEGKAPKDTASEEGSIKKVTLIENPFSVPIKHVPKSMDFPYVIKDSNMKFDIDIKDDDDFDIN